MAYVHNKSINWHTSISSCVVHIHFGQMCRRRTQPRSAAILILIAVALWMYSIRTLKGAAHTSAPETPPRLEPSIVANVRRNAGHGPQSTETTAPHPGTTIAICTLTKSRPSWKSLADTTLQKLLIPSIEHTVSENERSFYSIELHIGADHDDAFWVRHHNSLQHPPWLNLRFYFYTKTRRFRLPFNNLTDDAYANGADYLVRINDDTEFVTNGWVTKGVAALRGMRPPNVGVIGPHFSEGNTVILTHDMVHRTHIDIFGTYYPTVFDNWYVDDWITHVYGKDRTLKLAGWRVKHHTTAHGQRYVQSGHQHQHLENEVKTGAAKIDAWLSSPKQQSERQQTYPPAPQFTILYAGELWHTPSACSIVPVADATILRPNGQVRNKTGVYGFGKWYWEQKHLGVSAPRLLDGPLLTLVQVWNNNFQHIVFDTVPKLAFVCPFLRERRQVRVLVMNILQRNLVIEACPISEARFVVFENAIRAPVVYVPHFVGSDLKMGLVPPNSVPSLGLKTAQGSDVVYLARKAGATRSVANEAAVLATLREKWPDLRVVFPSNDWRKDRESVRTASVIIGPHGGALANMIFAPANTTIIEFTPLVQYKRDGKNERPCYFGLAHGLGFKYHAVEPSTFDFDSGSMMVPTDRLANAIESVGLSAGRSLVTRPPPGTQMGPEQIASIKRPCTHIVTDSDAGLFSNLMGVLAALSKYGTNIQVQWSNAMYLAPKSNNVWTQYFEAISSCIVDSSTKRIQMAGWDHGFVDPEASLAPMTRHIRLDSNMNALFEDYWTWHGEPSLGVHIRSTDRKTDAAKNLFVLPTLRYIQQIQRCLDKTPNIKTIFVASDTQVTLDALKNYFGAKIKSLDVVRSTDTRPIHHGHLDAPFNTGKSAVLDAWLLATTDFKVLSTSQLSAYAVLKQGPNTPFFNLNEEDGYKRNRKMFPSRPDSVTGWFPGLHQLTELRPSPDWTILLTVNDGFYDFFENWWTFFRRLEAVHRVVVVAEDDVAYAKLQTKTGLTVERSHLTQTAAHAYSTKEYNKMVSTRAGHILRHLRAGENVVYTDVDTVWLSDPTDYIPQGVDIVAQVDGQSYKGTSPYYCTGFMGIRSNERSIQLIERWGIQLAKTPQLNQPVFNRALRQTGGVRHLGLSGALFPNGDQYFRLMDNNKKRAVVVVHNNYIVGHDAKKRRFQDNGLWRLPNYKSR